MEVVHRNGQPYPSPPVEGKVAVCLDGALLEIQLLSINFQSQSLPLLALFFPAQNSANDEFLQTAEGRRRAFVFEEVIWSNY